MANLAVAIDLIGRDVSGSVAVDKVTKALDGAGQAAERSQGMLGRLTSGLSTFGLAANGLGTITNAVSGLAQSFTGPAQEMEAARARIQAFTKDQAQTEAILKAVRAEADKTPFSFGEMASAAASLGPTAKKAGVDLTSLLQTAEALNASDPAQGFEGAVMALREAMGGDFLSLRERFEVDTKEMSAAIKDGVPPIEAITAALGKQGINMDMVRGLAETTAGRMSTFQDSLEGLRRTAGEEILKDFGTQLDSMSGLITDNMDSLQALAKLLGQGIAAAIELAGAAFAAVMPILRDLVGVLAAKAPAAAEAMREQVMAVAGAVTTFAGVLFTAYKAVQPVVAALSEQLQPVFAFIARNLVAVVVPAFTLWAVTAGAAAAATVAALLPVIAPIVAIGAAAMLLKEAWTANWGDIQGKTEAVWGVLQPLFQAVADGLARFGAEFLPELVLAWQNMSALVQEVWTGLEAFLTPALEAFGAFWSEHWTTIQSVLQLVWDAMTALVTTALDGLSTLVLTFLDVLQGDWEGAWERIRGFLERTWERIGTLVDSALTLLGQALTTAWDGIANEVAKWWGAVAADLARIWDGIYGNTTALVNGIGAFLQQSWDNINRVANEWWTTIKDTIWNAISPLADLIGGLVKGIQEVLNSIKVPEIKMPTIAGVSVGNSPAATAAAAAAGGIDWAKKNFEDNAAKAHADNVAKGKGAGGPEILGGDLAANAGGAIQWAMSRLGQAGWVGWCERFVENAYGTGGRYASAWKAAQSLMTNPGGSIGGAPAGALVFFRPDSTNGGFGHVGISLGDGRMVSATNNGPEVTGSTSYWNNLFAGWGPPRFANGVTNFGGGMAIVGERGPELVNLPRGSDVIPNHRMASVGGTVEIHVHVAGSVVTERELAEKTLSAFRQKIGRSGNWDAVLSGVGVGAA